jgi:inorganic pyrophosphatase
VAEPADLSGLPRDGSASCRVLDGRRSGRFANYTDIDDLPEHLLSEVGNFFEVYKLLEPNKQTNVRGWEGRAAAEAAITSAVARHSH